jgi:serine/threonine protein phosphatase PrpC
LAVQEADYDYLFDSGENEESGTCANIVLFVDDVSYLANIGNSRAVLSMN